jgi:hypothetical protein
VAIAYKSYSPDIGVCCLDFFPYCYSFFLLVINTPTYCRLHTVWCFGFGDLGYTESLARSCVVVFNGLEHLVGIRHGSTLLWTSSQRTQQEAAS